MLWVVLLYMCILNLEYFSYTLFPRARYTIFFILSTYQPFLVHAQKYKINNIQLDEFFTLTIF